MPSALKNHFKILIVEDDQDDQFFLKKAFTSLIPSIEIIQVFNGEECFNYLQANKHSLPDLITMDLNMPLVNGLEATKQIRSNEHLKNLTIIILSTSDRLSDKKEATDIGANDYFIKPVEYDKLKLSIQEIIDKWLTA